MDEFAVRQAFLDWNREQPAPPVAIGKEYAVAEKLLELSGRATRSTVQQGEDSERIDWLEQSNLTFCGNYDKSGFRFLGSSVWHGTLREAIDAARVAHPADAAERKEG